MTMGTEWAGVRVLLQRAGLLIDKEGNHQGSTKLQSRGVALVWLEGVANVLQEHAPSFTALDLIRSKAAKQQRLWDAIPQRFIGPPSLRVLHAWNVPLASTLSTVVHQLRLRPSTLTDGQSGKPASVTHVWIEFVALDGAQLLTWAGRDEGGAEGQGDADGLIATARELSAGGVGSALLVANAAGVVMGSFRCLYDAWATLTYCGGDALAVGLALPADAKPALVARLMSAATSLNLTRLAAAREERGEGACTGLLADIKRLSGAQRACSVLGGALVAGLRLALQEAAPHSLRAAALRVGLFLGEGSLRLALACAKQTVAQYNVIPSYGDVCALFAVHAGGEAGGQWLGEEEVGAALKDAGMEDGEAGEVLWGMQERDTGAVSQTKWCDWWKGAEAVGLKKYTASWAMALHGKPEHATHRQLAVLLVKLCAALSAHKMAELEAYIRGTWAAAMQQPGVRSGTSSSGTSTPPPAPAPYMKTSAASSGAASRWPLLDSALLDAPLPAVMGLGAWRAAGVAALNASKRNVEGMAAAARRLYDVLLENTDLLPCHPLHLPRPPQLGIPGLNTPGAAPTGAAAKKGSTGEDGNSPVRTMLCLAAYMEVYGGHMLPALLGGVSDECGTMAEAAADLRSRASPGTKSLLSATNTLTTTEGQLLLADLIGLKYGEQLASRAMRVEAGLVMSTLTAAARRASVSLPAGGAGGMGGGGGGQGSGGFTGSKGSSGRMDALDTYLARGNSLDLLDRQQPNRAAPISAAAAKKAMVRRSITIADNPLLHCDGPLDAPCSSCPSSPGVSRQATAKSRRSSLAMPVPSFSSVVGSPGEFGRVSSGVPPGLLSAQASQQGRMGSEAGSQGAGVGGDDLDEDWNDLLTSTLMDMDPTLATLSAMPPAVPPPTSSVPRRSMSNLAAELAVMPREGSLSSLTFLTAAGSTMRRSSTVDFSSNKTSYVSGPSSPSSQSAAQLGMGRGTNLSGTRAVSGPLNPAEPAAPHSPLKSHISSTNLNVGLSSSSAPGGKSSKADGQESSALEKLKKREATWMALMKGGGSSAGGVDTGAATAHAGAGMPRAPNRAAREPLTLPSLNTTSGGGDDGASSPASPLGGRARRSVVTFPHSGANSSGCPSPSSLMPQPPSSSPHTRRSSSVMAAMYSDPDAQVVGSAPSSSGGLVSSRSMNSVAGVVLPPLQGAPRAPSGSVEDAASLLPTRSSLK